MIGRYDHQGILMDIRKAKGLRNGLVKIQHFLHNVTGTIGMTAVVYLGTFHHQEKGRLVLP